MRARPDFKPCWDPYLFAQQPYFMRSAFVQRKAAVAALAEALPESEWDLLWRIAEVAGPQRIAHLPRILFHRSPKARNAAGPPHPAHRHFERQRIAPTFDPVLPQTWRLRLPLSSPPPRVTVIVPTRDHADLLAAATDCVLKQTSYPDVELIVVDNGSTAAD